MSKIIFVIGATKSGGAEKRAILLSKLLKDKFQTKVFAFYGEKDNDIDFVFRNTYEKYSEASKITRIKALRNYLISERPDFVFSFIPHMNFFATRALKAKELKNVKHIISIVYPKYNFKESLLLRYSILNADCVYYQCEEQKRYIRTKLPTIVAANPIVIPPYVKKDDVYKMLSVGRLVEQKDYVLLIKAFSIISKVIPNAQFDIYGSGEKREELVSLIQELGLQEKIKIFEYTDDIYQVYNDHSVFLFASRGEGFPNVLAEAMANGLICFSTHFLTGCDELIKDKKTGFLCKSRNSEEYADIVTNVLSDKELVDLVSQNSYEHVKKLCDQNLFVDKMCSALKELK